MGRGPCPTPQVLGKAEKAGGTGVSIQPITPNICNFGLVPEGFGPGWAPVHAGMKEIRS